MSIIQSMLIMPGVSPSVFTTIADTAGTGTTLDPSGDTVVTIFTGVTSTASLFRLTLNQGSLSGPGTAGAQMTACYFGEAASTGDAYDFASSPARVQVLWGGSAAITIAQSGVYPSDIITTFTGSGTRPLMIAMQFDSNCSSIGGRNNVTPFVSYRRTGIADASTTDKSSYGSAWGTNRTIFFPKIESA